ncbi:MAG: hypothetical protein AVDCRST_MAG85-1861 [uncultured Solirubrobacteraceae bacterium]|uniref:Uncharacterized protein n=1 Tax=uncultured Solirubrobacteraceae bacterium TaxID=1162706 RepID=A0A6J4SNT5_9ACTN|nr:MAG: hypothetical protein AVDCRST_MAG85-1861 [uncultured Solirubrobacteraceae bacterium]
MAAETLVALAVVAVLGFLAGWIARGRDPTRGLTPSVSPGEELSEQKPAVAAQTRTGGLTPSVSPGKEPVKAPDAAKATLRLLDRAVVAYEAAVERWLDEGADVTPAGKAALGELDRAIKRVDVAAARLEEGSEPRFSALDALDALREAARLLQPYREGRAIDAATSRELDRLEDEVRRARSGLA